MNNSLRTPLCLAQAALAAIFFITLLFAGGSSRVDVPTLLPVRLSAICVITAIVLFADAKALKDYSRPAVGVLVAAIWMAAQLVPVPPALWLSLPGHAFYASVATVTGQPQPWRPTTLSPDLTLETMIALLPPLAAMLIGMRMPRSWIVHLPTGLLAIAAVSAMLAVFQLADGPESPLRFYPVADTDAGVGFFANRNHQALLMSIGIPCAIWWGLREQLSLQARIIRVTIGLAVVFLCVLGAIITGSRAGVVLSALALLSTMTTVIPILLKRFGWPGLIALMIAIGALCLVAITVLPYERLGTSLRDDPRVEYWARTFDLIAAFFPLGSGAGTFVRVFPRFETIGMLRPEYINHAHNDYLELVADNGIAGVLAIVAILVIFTRWCIAAARREPSRDSDGPVAKLALLTIALTMVASLVDYPSRTPLMGSIVALAAVVAYRILYTVPGSGH